MNTSPFRPLTADECDDSTTVIDRVHEQMRAHQENGRLSRSVWLGSRPYRTVWHHLQQTASPGDVRLSSFFGVPVHLDRQELSVHVEAGGDDAVPA